MARIESYQDLDVWQLAIALTEKCYRVSTTFPRDEVYGLTSQIRRAAVSIPANIAEGWGRDQTGYYIQFLRVVLGSTRELETHFIISKRLALLKEDIASPLQNDCERICKMLRSLIRRLEARARDASPT